MGSGLDLAPQRAPFVFVKFYSIGCLWSCSVSWLYHLVGSPFFGLSPGNFGLWTLLPLPRYPQRVGMVDSKKEGSGHLGLKEVERGYPTLVLGRLPPLEGTVGDPVVWQ